MGKIFNATGKSQQEANIGQRYMDDFTGDGMPDAGYTDTYYIDPVLVTGLEPQSIEAEQFRLLKNNILSRKRVTHPKAL